MTAATTKDATQHTSLCGHLFKTLRRPLCVGALTRTPHHDLSMQVCRAGVVILTGSLWRSPLAWRCILAFMNAKRNLCLLHDALPIRGGVDSLGAREPPAVPHASVFSGVVCFRRGPCQRHVLRTHTEAFIEAAPDEIKNHRDAYGVPHGLFATASSIVRFDRCDPPRTGRTHESTLLCTAGRRHVS